MPLNSSVSTHALLSGLCALRNSPAPLSHGPIVYNSPVHAATDPVDHNGSTPLCLACRYGLAEVAVALRDAGANIDFASFGGFTPLMIATMSPTIPASSRCSSSEAPTAPNASWASRTRLRQGPPRSTSRTLSPPPAETLRRCDAAPGTRRTFGDPRGAAPDVLQRVLGDLRRPGRGDAGRGTAPQAVRQVPHPRPLRSLLLEGVPTRGLGVAAPRGVRRGAAGAAGCRHRGLMNRGLAEVRD